MSDLDPLFGTNRSDDLRKVLDTWAKPRAIDESLWWWVQ